jgi:hypothetical protein
MVSSLAAAQDAVDQAVTRDALRTVADEYAAQTFGFDDARLNTIRSGWIFPPRCSFLKYPTLEVGTDDEAHGASPAMANRIYSAVNAAYVKQNLIQMGIDKQRAEAWTDDYFTALEAMQPPQPVAPSSVSAAQRMAVRPDRPAISPQIEAARVTPGPGLASAAHAMADTSIKPNIPISRLAATVSLKDRLALRTSAQIRTRPDGQDSPAARLARTINAASPKPVGFPPIIDTMSGGCMMQGPIALQTPHLLRLRPATGSVFVIPSFSFSLCALKTPDPYDRDKCSEWTDVSNEAIPLLGRYQISAEWPNGGRNRARRNFIYHPGASVWEIPLQPPPAP